MSFVSEYNLGRDESTTYFLASLACSLCELLRNGRSFHSQTDEAQADGASHRRGHRPFDDLAPYHSKVVSCDFPCVRFTPAPSGGQIASPLCRTAPIALHRLPQGRR